MDEAAERLGCRDLSAAKLFCQSNTTRFMGSRPSELTGSELYGAPENDLIVSAHDGYSAERPMTWRGAYTLLAGLVHKYDASGYEGEWKGNSLGLLDYPEPDVSARNKEWQERRERIAEQLPGGYHCPEFTQADARLQSQMYEERRKGWTQRAFKVLGEETAKSLARLDDYQARLATSLDKGNTNEAYELQQSVDYFEKQVADRKAHRAYLEDLFAQYPTEEAFVAEINRVGRAHLAWAEQAQSRLHELMAHAATMDLDAPVARSDWDVVVAQIAAMKTEYWQKTSETDVLRKVERGVYLSLDDVVREDVLDCYASPPASADGLDPAMLANLEPRLRHLECEKPHKLGGKIDSVYDDPLKKEHVLLFQMASDGATGWIFGDLGFVYVSIHRDDLEACRFGDVRAWLEA